MRINTNYVQCLLNKRGNPEKGHETEKHHQQQKYEYLSVLKLFAMIIFTLLNYMYLFWCIWLNE